MDFTMQDLAGGKELPAWMSMAQMQNQSGEISDDMKRLYSVMNKNKASANAVPVSKACAVCDKESTTRCSRCHTQYYCSRDCQKSDWASHKANCKKATA